jgi:hypothetical protein
VPLRFALTTRRVMGPSHKGIICRRGGKIDVAREDKNMVSVRLELAIHWSGLRNQDAVALISSGPAGNVSGFAPTGIIFSNAL